MRRCESCKQFLQAKVNRKLNSRRRFCNRKCHDKFKWENILKNNSNYKEKQRKYIREWYQKNKEHQNKLVLSYYYKNKGEWLERKYANSNKEKIYNLLPNKCFLCGKTNPKLIHHEKYDLLPRAKSKNYFARIKIKKTKKDGEYYDIVFGLKGQKDHAHYGIKVVAEKGIIGGKVFFIEPRQTTSHHRAETINPKTGEVISKLDTTFDGVVGKTGAEFHYGTIYDGKKKKLFLREFKIVEFDEPR